MAKSKKAKPARKPRPKQGQLPGLEDPKIPAIDEAADNYAEVRDERMELTKTEVTRRDTLLRLMQENGLETYRYDGRVVKVVKSEIKVKVVAAKDAADSVDVEEEEDDKE